MKIIKITWPEIEGAYFGKTYSPTHVTKELIPTKIFKDTWSEVPID